MALDPQTTRSTLPWLRRLTASSTFRMATLSLSPVLLLAACDGGTGTGAADVRTVSGYYDVEGVTTVVQTGDERPINGSVILSQDGEAYTATFHLSTSFATPDGNVKAEVVGSGQGMVTADRLVGTSETQILIAAFPGVDTKFPFLAQRYGPRVVSKSAAVIKPDGVMVIEIESVGAEGETNYAATTTSMTGVRGKPRGVEGFPLPDPAGSP